MSQVGESPIDDGLNAGHAVNDVVHVTSLVARNEQHQHTAHCRIRAGRQDPPTKTTARNPDRLEAIAAAELRRPNLLAGDVLKAVSIASGLPRGVITGQSRVTYVTRWRQVGIWIAYHATSRTLPELGRVFLRDHTTVLYAIRSVERRLEDDEDSEWRAAIQAVLAVLADLPPPVAPMPPPQATKPEPPPSKPAPRRRVIEKPHTRPWFEANDARFRAAFAAAHPDRVPQIERISA